MYVALLAGWNDIHTVRWANALATRGLTIRLFTQHAGKEPLHPAVQVRLLPFRGRHGYFLNALPLMYALRKSPVDLVHALYASGYGTLARLSGCQRKLVSVMGADVYDFPRCSRLHRRLVVANLRAAAIASTSHCMARETHRLAPDLEFPTVTPWGVDLEKFRALDGGREDGVLTLGTVKKLAPKYGIDLLIRAFARCQSLLPAGQPQLRLRLVGEGPQRAELEDLAVRCGVREKVDFVGAVPHDQVCRELNRLDVYCALSRLDSESFGVAVIEASACQRPVVVSAVGGLPEVVRDNHTGFIVPREDPDRAAQALVRLVREPQRRLRFGAAGRAFVQQHYDWHENVERMLALYRRLVPRPRRAVVCGGAAGVRAAA